MSRIELHHLDDINTRRTHFETNTNAIIKDGILGSLKVEGNEYFYPAVLMDEVKKPNWSNSELVMFPIVGPAKDFSVLLGSKKYLLDQHGISRALSFVEVESESSKAVFRQSYDGKPIKNPKADTHGHPKEMSWLSYVLDKEFRIGNKTLDVLFYLSNPNDEDMRFQFGWHPAFNIIGDKNDAIIKPLDKENESYNLMDVVNAPKIYNQTAIFVKNSNLIRYTLKDVSFEIETSGFNHFMLWCPDKDADMFCIEPVTHLQMKDSKQDYFNKLGQYNLLKPKTSQYFSVKIKIR